MKATGRDAAAHGTGKESGAGSRPATDPGKAQRGRAVRQLLPSITCAAVTIPWQQRRHSRLLLRSCQWMSICAASWRGLLRAGLTQGGCRSICQQVLQDLCCGVGPMNSSTKSSSVRLAVTAMQGISPPSAVLRPHSLQIAPSRSTAAVLSAGRSLWHKPALRAWRLSSGVSGLRGAAIKPAPPQVCPLLCDGALSHRPAGLHYPTAPHDRSFLCCRDP